MEESLSLPELQAILDASREREHRQNKFAAALKGVNLDEGKEMDAKEKFAEIQRRAEAKLTGKPEAQLEMDEFGIDIEIEE